MRSVEVLRISDGVFSAFNALNAIVIQISSETLRNWELFLTGSSAIRDPLYIEIKPLYSLRTQNICEKPLVALLRSTDEGSEALRTSAVIFRLGQGIDHG